MLDRERADFYRALGRSSEQLGSSCVAVALPIGSEHELTGVVDLLHMKAYTSPEGAKEGGPTEIPAELADTVAEYREKLLDAVVETDEALMERYLEGEELGVEEVAAALKSAVTRGAIFPVACGVATKNLGTTALLDLLVEGVPSPAKRGSPSTSATRPRRRSSSRRSPTRSRAGSTSSASSRAASRRDSTSSNGRAHARSGSASS